MAWQDIDPESRKENSRKGGETTRDRYGRDYFSRIGKKGGAKLAAERGREHFTAAGRAGGHKTGKVRRVPRESRKQAEPLPPPPPLPAGAPEPFAVFLMIKRLTKRDGMAPMFAQMAAELGVQAEMLRVTIQRLEDSGRVKRTPMGIQLLVDPDAPVDPLDVYYAIKRLSRRPGALPRLVEVAQDLAVEPEELLPALARLEDGGLIVRTADGIALAVEGA